MLRAYDTAVEQLANLGARIVRPTLPHRLADYAAATGRIIGAEGYRFVGHLVDDETLPVDPHVRPRIQIGRGVLARDYLGTLAEREVHQREFAEALADVDALLTPTTQTPAIPLDQIDQGGAAAHFTAPETSGTVRTQPPESLHDRRLPTSLQILVSWRRGHCPRASMGLRAGHQGRNAGPPSP